ncbi:MAG TPA: stage II sporulation protein D [Bacillaceae bacterium]
MKQLKPIAVLSALLILLSFSIPSLLVLPFSKEKAGTKLDDETKADSADQQETVAEVAVLRSQSNKIEKLPIEEYVIGVVASEMPADFEKEALKAQALAARTYIASHLLRAGESEPAEGYDVTDTVQHQVYKSPDEIKAIWKREYKWNTAKMEKALGKIKEAVKETEGQILTYNDKPITASFFSTSNGFTENAEDYWENSAPYLKSVESPWDSQSPKFTAQQTLSIAEFEKELGVTLPKNQEIGTITGRTAGKKVATVEIGGKVFTGREIREKLKLRSTDFGMVRKGDSIIITTKGYGHGVGMSQYGANGMAKEGKTYEDIVRHYYRDIRISNMDSYFDTKVAASR